MTEQNAVVSNVSAAITSQDKINSIVWKACDTFRGVVDPSEYKNYILVFLFIKYISDVWKDNYEKLVKEFGDDKERIRRRLERERFKLDKTCSYDYLFAHRNDARIGQIINEALEKIEEDNKSKLEGVFRNIDFNSDLQLGETRERNARLKNLIEDFSDDKLDLRPSKVGGSDIIGNVYEYLIARFAAGAGKKGGEFYTPPQVSKLLAKLVEPKEGDRICDPACGSGSLLIKAANEIGCDNYSLYGQESNGGTWALCKMNMFLHAKDNARVEWGDTLNNPKLIEGDKLMKFDVVVANPPFSLDKWGAENASSDKFNRFWRGVPPKNRGDYAFISHMVETAVADGGRAGVVVPHGVLFREGSEKKIRKQLIEEDNCLDAIVGLPQNMFYGTGIPAAILIFKKNRKNKDILFIDASADYASVKNQNILRDKDIEKIVKTYKARKSIAGYSYLASMQELKDNDYNLNIPRYVDNFKQKSEIDIEKTQKEIEELETKLTKVRKKIKSYLKEMSFDKNISQDGLELFREC